MNLPPGTVRYCHPWIIEPGIIYQVQIWDSSRKPVLKRKIAGLKNKMAIFYHLIFFVYF